VSKFNTDSNGYTLGFLAIMVIIVGGSLAFISSALQPTIDANQELDRRKKVLKAILSLPEDQESVVLTEAYVNAEYEEKVSAVLVNYQGEVIEESIPATYDFRKEMKDKSRKAEDKIFPVYTYQNGSEEVYVFQMIGMGLWDEINGYLALKSDKSTIQGVAFDHVGETPGLGAEMVKHKFRKQFYQQSLFDAQGEYDFRVYKSGKLPKDGKGVDGLAGATLTTDGIHDMLEKVNNDYSNYLSN
jgi:Na+-transporting NADH:ubiquinone oxidoreductase subunit C